MKSKKKKANVTVLSNNSNTDYRKEDESVESIIRMFSKMREVVKAMERLDYTKDVAFDKLLEENRIIRSEISVLRTDITGKNEGREDTQFYLVILLAILIGAYAITLMTY